MLLPTMPSAVMLLHLGSLSNLMKRSAAVFLIYSLPKNPNDSLEEGDGGEVSASPTPPQPPTFLLGSEGGKWEHGYFQIGWATMLSAVWKPYCLCCSPHLPQSV